MDETKIYQKNEVKDGGRRMKEDIERWKDEKQIRKKKKTPNGMNETKS